VVGQLTVSITKSGQTTSYTVESAVNLPLNISYNYTLKSTYNNTVLISSTIKSYLNNVLHRAVSTTKNGESYAVNVDGKEHDFKELISYSEALIYAIEPKNQSKLYSDFSGYNKSIKSLGNHKYKLTNLENGNTSTYKYKNGVLQNARIDFGLIKFSLIKK
jgi:hypothetical protein